MILVWFGRELQVNTVNSINVKKAEHCTNPFLNGHEAGELRQDGELFAQFDDEVLQLRLLPLEKQKPRSTCGAQTKLRWAAFGLTQ